MKKKIKSILVRSPFVIQVYRKAKNVAIIPLKYTSYNIFNLKKFPLRDLINKEKTSLFKTVWPFTKNGYSRLENVYDCAIELEEQKVKGSFIECGVYKGGCCAIMGAVAKRYGNKRKTWYLDSFEGMPDPTPEDGNETEEIEGDALKASVSDVEELVYNRLKLARDKNIIVKGWFENVLPDIKKDIGDIALLRLDADWYEPTKFILEELYDQVVPGGYVIFDDYGRWEGCRKAVDDFIKQRNLDIKMKFVGGMGGTKAPMYFKKK